MDNVTPDSASTDIIAADDVGGVKYQRIKIVTGSDGTILGDVTKVNPLPVATVVEPVEVTLTNVNLATPFAVSLPNVVGKHYFSVVLGTTADIGDLYSAEPTFQLFGSKDMANWYEIGCTIRTTSKIVYVTFSNECANSIKLVLSSTVGKILSFVTLSAE